MNILFDCWYEFPARGSAGSERIVERLCRGFVKLGHKVYLRGKPGSTTDTGAIVVDHIPADVDIIHKHGFELEKQHEYNAWGKPWVSTIHGGGMENDPKFLNGVKNHPNIICVSKFVSDRLQCPAFVHSCVSSEEFYYNPHTTKEGFLYLAGFGWGMQKGLDIFIDLSKKFPRSRFFIAGAGGLPQFVDAIKDMCKAQHNLSFLGEVNGKEKANVLSTVEALIYPTHLADACPSSVVEALYSGTPVIGSANGSMPEIVPPQCGFICKTQADYMKAVIWTKTKIKRHQCRLYAEDNYSDIVAAKKHLTYYENVIKFGRTIE